jgi:hypothetical protein
LKWHGESLGGVGRVGELAFAIAFIGPVA